MQTQIPLTRDIVLIGGGHAHALVLRMWGMRRVPGVRLTVIDPQPVATYTGMLPGLVAGHYTEEETGIDLVRLCRFAGARLVLGAVTGMNLAARRIRVAGSACGAGPSSSGRFSSMKASIGWVSCRGIFGLLRGW